MPAMVIAVIAPVASLAATAVAGEKVFKTATVANAA
jgi:hypothetical protein